MIKHATSNRLESDEPTDAAPAGGGALGNLILVTFLLLLFGLAIRGLVIDDSRFSWGMFSENLEYLVMAYWVYPDGQLVQHIPGRELGGKSVMVTPRAHERATRVTRYAPGTVRRWCQAYAEYLFKHRRPVGAERMVVKFTYAIEPTFREQQHEFTTESISYPNEHAEPKS